MPFHRIAPARARARAQQVDKPLPPQSIGQATTYDADVTACYTRAFTRGREEP